MIPDDLHARRLLVLAGGVRLASVVRLLAVLGIEDHLARGPLTVRELAGLADCDERSLDRLLRCSTSVGVFARLDDGRIAPTPLSGGLCTGAPDSIRPLVLYNGAP